MTTLLVASTGGHLAELYDLAPRLNVSRRRWVTFDSPQSRTLLDGEDVVFVPPATSHDPAGVLRQTFVAARMLRRERYRAVVSTGASVALAFFLPARAAAVPCCYIESATRTDGPSLTGRLVARLPGTRLFTQHPGWADDTWRYGGSVFDAFVATPVERIAPVKKVVVTLGTHPRYRFPRLLNRLVRMLPPELEVLWQVGWTRVEEMPRDARTHVPMPELRQALAEADAVISHAGVGSALAAMHAGRRAVYVPRRRAHREHVDDHQVQMAHVLQARRLVLAREAEEVDLADLEVAAGWSVRARSGPAGFPAGLS